MGVGWDVEPGCRGCGIGSMGLWSVGSATRCSPASHLPGPAWLTEGIPASEMPGYLLQVAVGGLLIDNKRFILALILSYTVVNFRFASSVKREVCITAFLIGVNCFSSV